MTPVAASDAPLRTGRIILTREGWVWLAITLAFGGLGWWKGMNLVLILAYLMLVLFLANGFLSRRIVRHMTAVRESRIPVFANEETAIQAIATNTGPGPITAIIEERAGEIEPVRWLIHHLPAGESIPCTARRIFTRRGCFRSPLTAFSGFPFGLLQYGRTCEAGVDLLVLPEPGLADSEGLRRWVMQQVGGEGRTRKVLRRVTTDQADVRGVRPYRAGDSIRSIHWRSSARRRELMVREYDTAPAPELLVVVEPWLPSNPTREQTDRLEAALSLAATIVRTWGRGCDTKVTVAVAGDAGSIRTSLPTDESLRLALAPLAAVVGASEFAPFRPDAFDRALARAARLVVSSRPATPFADALTRSIGRPFVAISPADRLPWYQAPGAGVRRQNAS